LVVRLSFEDLDGYDIFGAKVPVEMGAAVCALGFVPFYFGLVEVGEAEFEDVEFWGLVEVEICCYGDLSQGV